MHFFVKIHVPQMVLNTDIDVYFLVPQKEVLHLSTQLFLHQTIT